MIHYGETGTVLSRRHHEGEKVTYFVEGDPKRPVEVYPRSLPTIRKMVEQLAPTPCR